MTKKKVTMIDLPSGWKYGLPKPLPENIEDNNIMRWLVENGYPQWEIDKLRDHFYCRYRETALDINSKGTYTI